MIKQQLKEYIIEFYPLFFKQVSGNKKYKFRTNDTKDKQIDKFIDYLETKVEIKTIGEDFIKRYLKFAFGRVTNKYNHHGKQNAFPFTWIVARTVLDTFLKSDGNEKFKKTYRLNKQGNSTELIKSSATKKKESKQKIEFALTIKEVEEKEKSRFYNTNKGKYWCIDFTTLYNSDSEYCKGCKHSESCKLLLQNHYPSLFKIRDHAGKV